VPERPAADLAARATTDSRGRRLLLGAGLLLVSLNLRPSMSALSPVLGAIRRSTGLSAAGAGLLTTLPLVCFGLLAPVAPRLVRRRGTGQVLLGCLLVLLAGIVVRSSGYLGLFVGTLLIGVSVAVANVLMPGIVKRDFPGQVSLMTGLYTAMLSAGAALAAGTTAPLARALGGNWRLATGAWALPVVVAVAVVVPLRHHGRPEGALGRVAEPSRMLLKSPVAWAVTLFMGVQSLEFYSTLAWLPTVFHNRGVSVVDAGLLLALSNSVGIGAALVTPWVAHRLGDVRIAVLGAVALATAGLAGLLFDPRHLDALWAVLLGCGQGATISLALMVMVLRSANQYQAMALSGMAQGFGYLIAAVGPTLLGGLYDLAHNWDLPLALLLALLGVQAVAGCLAAKNRPVNATSAGAQISDT
jgi:CP family cyanate transporter-like MFS transporter